MMARFTCPGPSDRCRFGEETFDSPFGNGSNAPLPAIRGPPGGGIPENKIVVKDKSKIHLPALGLGRVVNYCNCTRNANHRGR